MEIFRRSHVQELLFNRFVVIIGDSIQRCIYKDMVLLLQEDRHLTESEMKRKGEETFLNDELIEGGCKGEMSNGIFYREIRQFRTNVHLVRFYFVTRCYNSYMETILRDLRLSPHPDILIMNSCLWDITRYGSNSIIDYKENLITLFDRFSESLSPKCLVIWNTTLPISSSARGGFLVPEIDFKSTTLRLDILEANYYTQKLATDHGFDVLDLHFYLRHHLDMRAHDGIHWNKIAHRNITKTLLAHIHEAWGIPMPDRQMTFGSYGSTYARNGYYQQLTPNRQTSLEPLNNGPVNFQNSFVIQPIQSSMLLTPDENVYNFGNTAAMYNQFMWQPYQQSSSSGSMSSHTHYRHRPYRHRRH